ncbi:plasmalemma vesicle-associated protein [Tachyglossus aculeatus]|uniref:plasmalemma vesicle-associated protein n=1 Tax=Tachyglossus aculeatus TaxID=9261 RepID=UPI0018F28AF5|nr:plasmalemma vesicle-associated protein [Tachyglossus aculeatus]
MDRNSTGYRMGNMGTKSKGCWYYMKYFFLFVSLIQFLIILGLVLFMVYGNPQVGTEEHLHQVTQKNEALYSKNVKLLQLNTNISKDLNLTRKSREEFMQMLVNSRREQDRINASFKQCHMDRMQCQVNMKYTMYIVKEEEICKQDLKELNNTHITFKLHFSEKVKKMEQDKENLQTSWTKQKEEFLVEKNICQKNWESCKEESFRQLQELQRQRSQIQDLQNQCLKLDEKFFMQLKNLWQESIIPKTLNNLISYSNPYSLPINYATDLNLVRQFCDTIPTTVTTKVSELVQQLRVDVIQKAQENTDLHRQKELIEQNLQACQKSREANQKEALSKYLQLQTDCTKQGGLALEEKMALRKEKEGLLKQLEEKERQLADANTQVAIKTSSLEFCIRSKAGPLGNPVTRTGTISGNPGILGNAGTIDKASLEEFKKKMLEQQRMNMFPGNPLGQPSG